MKKPHIKTDIEEIRKLLHYCPKTGIFTWKQKRGGKATQGMRAGTTGSRGYEMIALHKTRFRSHRLAFALVTGRWPTNEIDHINGDTSDNRWDNLREATRSQNMQNIGARKTNITGIKGISWSKGKGKWHARTRDGEKEIHVGYYDTLQEAALAVKNKREELHGNYAHH
jgi:hypothetical protein